MKDKINFQQKQPVLDAQGNSNLTEQNKKYLQSLQIQVKSLWKDFIIVFPCPYMLQFVPLPSHSKYASRRTVLSLWVLPPALVQNMKLVLFRVPGLELQDIAWVNFNLFSQFLLKINFRLLAALNMPLEELEDLSSITRYNIT